MGLHLYGFDPQLYLENQPVTHQQETNKGCLSVLAKSSMHFLISCKTQQAEYLGVKSIDQECIMRL